MSCLSMPPARLLPSHTHGITENGGVEDIYPNGLLKKCRKWRYPLHSFDSFLSKVKEIASNSQNYLKENCRPSSQLNLCLQQLGSAVWKSYTTVFLFMKKAAGTVLKYKRSLVLPPPPFLPGAQLSPPQRQVVLSLYIYRICMSHYGNYNYPVCPIIPYRHTDLSFRKVRCRRTRVFIQKLTKCVLRCGNLNNLKLMLHLWECRMIQSFWRTVWHHSV